MPSIVARHEATADAAASLNGFNMGSTTQFAYVGSVVPDTPEYRNEAFSRAGNMFQENLLAGLRTAGTMPSLVLGVRPMPAFPRSATLIARSSHTVLPCGIPITLLPFVNISPVKQLLLGAVVFFRLLRWGWKHRGAQVRIVYTFNLTVPPALFTLLAARCIKAKAVASVNDINEPGATVPRTWPWRLDYALHQFLLPRFDALVPVSQAIIEDFAPKARYVRVEGGITPEMAANSGRDIASGKPDTFCIVFSGGMDAANGVEVMLHAIARLKGGHYRFVFAGGGPLAGAVFSAARADVRIEYRGVLKLSDLLSIYRQADVLVNMRLTKAIRTRYFFPSKLMEFLASGTPVISTCPGHVEEEFGEFLFLLKNESPEGLAAAIQHAETAGLETRREMGKRARGFMLAHKTWQAQTARINVLLEGLAGKPVGGSSCR